MNVIAKIHSAIPVLLVGLAVGCSGGASPAVHHDASIQPGELMLQAPLASLAPPAQPDRALPAARQPEQQVAAPFHRAAFPREVRVPTLAAPPLLANHRCWRNRNHGLGDNP